MIQEKGYSEEIRKMEDYLTKHDLTEIELNGVNVSIHQETLCNGHERTVDRTGYITLISLEDGNVTFWDYDESETIQLEQISCGLDEIIKSFWSKIELT